MTTLNNISSAIYQHDSDSERNDHQNYYSRYYYPYADQLYELYYFIQRFFVSKAEMRIVTSVLSSVSPLVIITTGIGIVANVINMSVFRRQGILSESYTLTLAALALNDAISCTITFLTGTIEVVFIELDKNNPDSIVELLNGKWVTPIALSTLDVCRLFTIFGTLVLNEFTGWATAFMAVERMVSVTFPFKVKAVFTPKRACLVLSGAFLVVFALQLPRLMSMGFKYLETEGPNKVRVLRLLNTNFVPAHISNYLTLVNKTILSVLCIVIIIACNVIIVVKVKHSQRFRKSTVSSTITDANDSSTSTDRKLKSQNTSEILQQSDQTEKETTKVQSSTVDPKMKRELKLIRVMYLLSITFLISRIPGFFMHVVEKLQANISVYYQWWGFRTNIYFYKTLDHLANYLILLNASTNICIYYAMSSRYRQTITNMFSCGKKTELGKKK